MGEVGARQEREPRPNILTSSTVVEELRISDALSGLCEISFSQEALPTAKQPVVSIDAATN